MRWARINRQMYTVCRAHSTDKQNERDPNRTGRPRKRSARVPGVRSRSKKRAPGQQLQRCGWQHQEMPPPSIAHPPRRVGASAAARGWMGTPLASAAHWHGAGAGTPPPSSHPSPWTTLTGQTRPRATRAGTLPPPVPACHAMRCARALRSAPSCSSHPPVS
jgi:hypothetical protein